MSTQLPTWRFHAVDTSLLVRVDHDDDEASVRPRAKSTRPASSSSNAAGKAAATRKMDQLKEQIAVRRASHDLEQLKMQIAARQAAAMAAPSAANVASVARVKKRAQQPAADGAEAGTSAAGAVSPAKRLRKAAAAKPAPAAAPAPAQPLGKVDNGRSLTTTTAASPVDDDGRPLTDGQLWRVLRALDTAGLLAATGAEARAQAALRPLLAGPSALATLLPLTAPPPPPPSGGPAAAIRRSPAKKGVVARVPAKRGSVASGKATGKAGAGAPASTATAAGAAAATVTTTTTTAASKSGGAPPAASVARASALLAQHVARLGGAIEPAPVSAALQQLLIDCRACERFVPWWAAVKPADGASGASRARRVVPPAVGGRAQGAGGHSQSDSQSTTWWRSVLFDEPALAAAEDGQPTVPRLGSVGTHSSTDAAAAVGPGGGGGGEAEAEGAASRARAEAAVLEGVRSHEYVDSPLLALRAGRLGAFYSSRAGGGLALSGSLGRQRLEPSRPVCRFELRGDCRDPSCSGQHRRQYLQSVPELCVELRAYAGEKVVGAVEAGEAGVLPPAVGEEEEPSCR